MVISQALTFQKMANVPHVHIYPVFEDASFEVVHNVFIFTVHQYLSHLV